MMPMMLDLSAMRVVLTGNGPAAVKRLQLLDQAGAAKVTVFADDPIEELVKLARGRLVRRLPKLADLEGARLLLVADIAESRKGRLATLARRHGLLVNVEDRPKYCDFHVPSVVRRGDLTLTVSTNGRAPGLSRKIRRWLEEWFGPEWAGRLEEVSRQRREWRVDGENMDGVTRRIEQMVDEKGWL